MAMFLEVVEWLAAIPAQLVEGARMGTGTRGLLLDMQDRCYIVSADVGCIVLAPL